MEEREGGIKVSSCGYLSKDIGNLDFGQRCFLSRHLLNRSLRSIRKTHCCRCLNDSQRSILSFLGGIIIKFRDCLEFK